MRLVVFVSISYILIGSCEAETFNNPLVLGVGNDPCAAATISFAETQDMQQSKYAQWVLGFFAGSNFFNVGNASTSYFAYDEKNLMSYVEKYCRENPDKPVFSAIEQFQNRKWVVSP
jgi:hypothetical protein